MEAQHRQAAGGSGGVFYLLRRHPCHVLHSSQGALSHLQEKIPQRMSGERHVDVENHNENGATLVIVFNDNLLRGEEKIPNFTIFLHIQSCFALINMCTRRYL